VSIEPPRLEEETPVTYFNEPVLKGPHWGWNVVTYLFLGGIMGGSSMIAAMADRAASPAESRLVRNANFSSLALAAACPLLLISHLGRPERFLHMLRILKFKSPMSMGVWGLVLFSNIAALTSVRELAILGTFPRWMGYLAPPGAPLFQALLGSFIAGYTGVLLSATAVPIWVKGKRHIPAMGVASGLGSACALQSFLLLFRGNEAALQKLERLELATAATELLLLFDFEKHAGPYGVPMFEGARGRRLRSVTILAGLVGPIAINSLRVIARPRGAVGKALTLAASVLTLYGGYVFRDTLIESGKDSARDPKAGFAQPE